MLPLLQSKLNVQSNLLTGVPLVSRLALTTSHQQLFLAEILPRWLVLFVCSPTQQQLLKHGQGLIISLILCTPSEPLFIGMWVKVWKRENSLKLVKILLLLKRTTKRLVWTLLMEKEKKRKDRNIKL